MKSDEKTLSFLRKIKELSERGDDEHSEKGNITSFAIGGWRS